MTSVTTNITALLVGVDTQSATGVRTLSSVGTVLGSVTQSLLRLNQPAKNINVKMYSSDQVIKIMSITHQIAPQIYQIMLPFPLAPTGDFLRDPKDRYADAPLGTMDTERTTCCFGDMFEHGELRETVQCVIVSGKDAENLAVRVAPKVTWVIDLSSAKTTGSVSVFSARFYNSVARGSNFAASVLDSLCELAIHGDDIAVKVYLNGKVMSPDQLRTVV